MQKASQADVISLNKTVFTLAIVKKLTDKDNPRNNLSFPAFFINSDGQIGERIHIKTKGMPNIPTESAPLLYHYGDVISAILLKDAKSMH